MYGLARSANTLSWRSRRSREASTGGEQFRFQQIKVGSLCLLKSSECNCPVRFRTGIAAGSSVPIELMKKLIAKLNLVDLTNAYGMSEYVFLACKIISIYSVYAAETRYISDDVWLYIH